MQSFVCFIFFVIFYFYFGSNFSVCYVYKLPMQRVNIRLAHKPGTGLPLQKYAACTSEVGERSLVKQMLDPPELWEGGRWRGAQCCSYILKCTTVPGRWPWKRLRGLSPLGTCRHDDLWNGSLKSQIIPYRFYIQGQKRVQHICVVRIWRDARKVLHN